MTDTYYEHTSYIDNSQRDVHASRVADELFPDDDCRKAREVITTWPGYEVTPLHELTDIAAAAGVARIVYKDESSRLGLGAFKALGGAYAVRQWYDQQLANGKSESLAVCTATDGNHGRSVAWGAQLLGIECHIFIHAGVSQNRADSMTELGATVHRVDGNYDHSIAECIRLSEEQGWQIVSDTSWEGYRDIPNQVMAGYTVLAAELVEQLDGVVPTHIFLQAGCGGMAGALTAYFWQQWREQLPEIVIVESSLSDCVFQSLKKQEIVFVDIVEETLMAGLSCGEVSALAWPTIQKSTSVVITLGDDGVAPMMQWLASPTSDRPAIEGGECSASGLIGVMAASRDEGLGASVRLDEKSVVVVIGTEGATDKEQYDRLIRG